MNEILGSIWWLLVALGLLITFHEFGHFWVARRLGVRVLRFSVGFGRPIWSRRGADGVEYVVAAIPLGGYVKMLDEREGPVPADDLGAAFNRQPVWSRIAIVLAGPAFNLVMAVIAFWVMFMVGIPDSKALIGATRGLAAEAGLAAGDEIVRVEDKTVRTWSHALLALITRALDREPVTITVADAAGARSDHRLALDRLGPEFNEERTLDALGIEPWRLAMPAVVGSVTADGAAAAAGLRAGDRIIAIAGEAVSDWTGIGPLVQRHGRVGEPLVVTIERAGATQEVRVEPQRERAGLFSGRLVLGITNQDVAPAQREAWERSVILLRYGPLDALGSAVHETGRLTAATLGLLARMVTGRASVKNLSGPITIAQFANQSARRGLSNFLFFLGAISLSLGILNLLPIPVLDGGHLMYFLAEWVKGSPVSERAQIAGQYFGLVALAGLMSLAFVNDILRLLG